MIDMVVFTVALWLLIVAVTKLEVAMNERQFLPVINDEVIVLNAITRHKKYLKKKEELAARMSAGEFFTPEQQANFLGLKDQEKERYVYNLEREPMRKAI